MKMARTISPPAIAQACRCTGLILFCLLNFGLMQAQGNKWVRKGNDALAERAYLQAIEYYQWSLRQDTSVEALSGLARCYHGMSDFRQSAQWWKAAAKRPDAPAGVYFSYGRALLSLNKPDEAALWFQKYHDQAPNDPQAAQYKDVQTWLPQMFRDSALYSVSRLRLNSKHADFGAAWFPKGVLFCSNRPAEVGVIHSSASDGLPLVDMYFSEWDSAKGFVGKAKPMPEFNTRFHEGPACFDAAMQRLYITRTNTERVEGEARGGVGKLGIFIYQLQEGKWIEAGSLPSKGYSVAHPAISADGKAVYFSSDMPGGQGGTDIWMLEKNGNDWGALRNAGPAVNTPENESYPAFQSDGTLYFASDGHPGLGGLDIFLSRPDGRGGWNRPLNPGAPINSPQDDFGFLPKGEGSQGLFSSNRNAAVGDDIWEYKRTRPAFDCKPQVENNYCFRFWETGSIETDTLPLFYAWDMGDGTFLRGLEVFHCFAGPGDYVVQLNLVDSTSGFIFLNEATYEMNIRDAIQVYIEAPDTVETKQSVQMDGKKTKLEGCNPAKYYWEFGDGGMASGVETTHIWRTAGTYEIKLGVSGDMEGSSEPCLACVTRKVVVMDPKKLAAYRDSLARAKEANPFGDKVPDIKEKSAEMDSSGKALRDIRDSLGIVFRVQLKESKSQIPLNDPIFKGFKDKRSISEIHADSIYKYTYGSEKTRDKIYPYYEEAREKGFEDALVVAFKENRAVSGSDSSFSFKIPVRIEGDRVTIFSGSVKDAQGDPLMAEITLEDLMKRVEVVRVKTDSGGAFQLRLPDGRIYGYYIEAPGHFPYSDYVDLRQTGNMTQKDVVISQSMTMRSIEDIVEKGSAVRVNNIFFDYDQAEIKPESYPELKRLSAMLASNQDIKVEILGHTDNAGEASYNHDLSLRRANAVAQYLKNDGLGNRVIRTIGYGEILPLATNDTPEGRQQNRRVEFRLIKY